MKAALPWALAGLVVSGLAAPLHAQGKLPPPTLPYDLLFEATLLPTERLARARLRIGKNQVDRLVFRIDPDRHMNVRGDGKVEVEDIIAFCSQMPRQQLIIGVNTQGDDAGRPGTGEG